MKSLELKRRFPAFSHSGPECPEVFDLHAAVESMMSLLHGWLGENIGLVWEPCSGTCRVSMVPDHLNHILACLVINAKDAIGLPSVGTVEIRTGIETIADGTPPHDCVLAPGCYATLSVSDNGCGMNASRIEHASKTDGSGTGHNLSAIFGIVKQNGGSIRVSSEPGNGSRITILLPLFPDTNACQEPAADGIPHAGTETVLLVEDYPEFLPIAAKALRHLGYKVVTASTPDHAISQFHERPDGFDILITDVVMPDMNGCEISRILTALKPDLKTLYMSGYTSEMLCVRGMFGGREAFLQKPFSLAEMARQIRSLLDGHASS